MSRHRYECRVRFSDVDVYGHVNNVKYFEYYQEARLSLMTELGRGDDMGRFGLVVARIDVDYKRPILFRSDPYLVESWVTALGDSSFGLAAEIKDDAEVLSRARAVMVTIDLDTQRSRPLSDKERERLAGVAEL